MKAKKKKKKEAQPKPIPSSKRRSGTSVLGRVNSDFAGFVWDLSDSEVKTAAESISKHIEISYQLQLIRSSGFGQESE